MPRSYVSPLREQRADATRTRILEVAARLFSEQGYAQTSVRQLAAQAGVSLDRIYHLGGKAAIFLQALEAAQSGDDAGTTLMDTDSAVRSFETDTAEEALRALADLIVRSHERSAALWTAFVQGAAVEPELAGALRVREAEMRRQVGMTIDQLVDRGLISAPRDPGIAGDLCWAAAHPAQWALLVGSAGWTASRFRDWLQARNHALLVDRVEA